MKMTCLVRIAALSSPDAIALQDGERNVTYSEYDRLVTDAARRLRRLSISHGDRVAILGRNSIEYAVLVFAAARASATSVLLNPRHSPEEWASAVAQSHSRVLLLDSEFRDQVTFTSVPIWTIDGDTSDSITRIVPADEEVAREIDTELEATVVFTSGSSGQPKGVIHTYVSHYLNAVGSNENIRLDSDDCWLLSLSLCHVGGLAILFRTALSRASAFLTRRFDLEEANALIDSETVTHLSLVPTMLSALLLDRRNRPLPPTLEAALVSGAPIPASLIEKSRELNLPLYTSYGLTEAGSQVCTLAPNDKPDRFDTVGRPLKHRELSIIDSAGRPAADGSVGEILIRGEVLLKSYLDGNQPLDSEGWFHTGDLGKMDTRGYLTVLGRKDDMMISGGENIYPREIEMAAEDFAGVTGCAVIAVDDEKWGQRPVLFVETTQPTDFDLVSLRNHLQQRLSRLKMPDAVLAVETLPRLGIGKLDKGKLAELYAAWAADQGSD